MVTEARLFSCNFNIHLPRFCRTAVHVVVAKKSCLPSVVTITLGTNFFVLVDACEALQSREDAISYTCTRILNKWWV